MKTILILSGIPLSGKSTFAEQTSPERKIISRDKIREELFGKDYKQNSRDEIKITSRFHELLCYNVTIAHGNNSYPIILDNTFCKEGYINEIIKDYSSDNVKIQIKFFDTPLYKAYYRNIIRYLRTGKYIPVKVIRNMKKSYNKINKNKYGQYLV